MSHYADRRIHGNAVHNLEAEAKMLCTSSSLKGPRSIPLLRMQMISHARIACHALVYLSGPISDERASGRAVQFGFWKMPFSIFPFYCFFPFYHSPFFSARVRVKSMRRRRRRRRWRREAPRGAQITSHMFLLFSLSLSCRSPKSETVPNRKYLPTTHLHVQSHFVFMRAVRDTFDHNTLTLFGITHTFFRPVTLHPKFCCFHDFLFQLLSPPPLLLLAEDVSVSFSHRPSLFPDGASGSGWVLSLQHGCICSCSWSRLMGGHLT